jgi:hypothetical protein
MMQLVCGLSNRSFNDRFILSDQIIADAPIARLRGLIAQHTPTALLIADAQVTPEVLANLLPEGPNQLFLYGRWLEAHHASGYLPKGFSVEEGFDANILRAYRRPAD